MQELEWATREQTRKWVHTFTKQLKRPCVVLLSGDLGAGKTQLVKWFLEELQVQGASSPTFAIHQQHDGAGGLVDHVDLYRLKSDADLESSGFWDLLAQSQALLFVEWADRLPDSIWPEHWTKVTLDLRVIGTQARRARLAVVEPKAL